MATYFGIRKIAPHRKLPATKFPPMKIPPMNILPYESSPLWKLPPRNLLPRKLSPMKSLPMKTPPHLQIIQMKVKTKIQNFLPWRKLCNTTFLSKWPRSSLIHRCFHRKFWAQILSLQNEKNPKIKRKRKSAKSILLASCTSQEELKLDSQLNSQLSLHITLWI